MYENDVLERIAGLHKIGSQVDDGAEANARGEQLRAQTSAVSTRKHFYRTEVYQVQDVLLKEKVRVNFAIVLGAATAVLQATAARSGMFTRDEYDEKSAFWCGEQPLRVRDVVASTRPAVFCTKYFTPAHLGHSYLFHAM